MQMDIKVKQSIMQRIHKSKHLAGLFFLCLGLACVTNSVQVSAKKLTGKIGDNITWKIEKDVLTLSGKGNMKDCGHKKPLRDKEDYVICEDRKYGYNEYYDEIQEVKEVVVEEGITGIGSHAFEAIGIKKATIASSVKTIGHCAFKKTNLEQIIISDSVSFIGEEAFDECHDLKSVQLSKNIKKIPRNAFASCYSLKEINIPKKVEFIGRQAFQDCLWLRKVNYTSDSKLKEIDILAFDGCNIEKMMIPSGVERIHSDAINSSHEIIADKNNPYFLSEKGVLFSKDKKTLVCYPNRKTESTYRIPTGVKTIERAAFCKNDFLEKLIMPDTVTTVKKYACLAADHLKTVRFSKKLKKIEKRAFDCHLISLKLPNSLEYIGEGAFNCMYLSKIVIPKNVKKIGKEAFKNANNVKQVIVKTKKLKRKIDLFTYADGDVREQIVILPKSKKKSYKKLIPNYYQVKYI